MGKKLDWGAAMKRVCIVVEGQTEQEFVNSMLAPYLQRYNIFNVNPVLIHTSSQGRGGMVHYQHLFNTIRMLLSSVQVDFIVTTFIDFFRIPHTMPKYVECMAKMDDRQRVVSLETALYEDINDRRFLPYIQLHEFEALLFSNNTGFEYYFPKDCFVKTADIISSYVNPEDINSSPQGAPSKRLLSIKPDYRKVLEGNLIALQIGIDVILEKCPRFAAWVEKMKNVAE